MRVLVLAPLALLVACAGEAESPDPAAPADGAAAPAPEPAPSGPIREEVLLARPAPELGPNGRAVTALTEQLGVGAVRCPLGGGGKARVRHGTPRDGLLFWGILMSLELDPAEEPVWNTVFDQVTGEEDWVTFPAMPGKTRSWIDTRDRTLEMDHPPAVAGETVTCTAVREVDTRTVKGKVEGTVPPGTHFVPCFKKPPPVAADGTFLVEVPVPCTGWIEGSGQRSEKLRIDAGEGALEHTFTLQPDTLQRPDRTWTPAGLEAARTALARIDRSRQQSNDLLEQVKADLKQDPEATETLSVWKTGLWEQKLLLENAATSLKNDEEKAKAATATP